MPHKSAEREVAKSVVKELLLSGAVIMPGAVASQAGITVPTHPATQAWLTGYIRGLVHDVAEGLGLAAMSLGAGRGYKLIQTVDEAREAAERAGRQLAGMGKRRQHLQEKLTALNSLQMTLPLQGGATVAADAPPGPAKSQSA